MIRSALHLDHIDLRLARKVLAVENMNWPLEMTALPPELWPLEVVGALRTAAPIAAWRSRGALAMLFEEPGKPGFRLSIIRTVINPDGRYADGLSWDDLQRIKAECGFGSRDAVELYPADRDVVNIQNMRHLWILRDPSPFAWRADDGAQS